MTGVRIGVDLGGTKMEAIAIDDGGRELARRRVATPAHDYAAIVDAVAVLVRGLEEAVGLPTAAVGIGTPGSLSPRSGCLRNSNTTSLNGKPFLQDIGARLQRPVRIANDANCFALSEALDGAAAGAAVVFGVILGTGVGGGLVIHGQPHNGVNGIGGEWGHNPLPWPRDDERPGPPCYCGKRGCLETFLSGPGLQGGFHSHTGEHLSVPAIAARARAGDAGAGRVMDRYLDRLARGLATVINVLDPAVIVLGGGLSNIQALYSEVPARWNAYVFSDVVGTRLVPARHGDASGVRGAARLWTAAGL